MNRKNPCVNKPPLVRTRACPKLVRSLVRSLVRRACSGACLRRSNLNPHGLRGQPCPLPCPALSVPCPDLQRRIPAKCAAVPALSAAFSVSLVRKFCARPPRGSWTKPLNKAFFKLLLVRALSGSSMAWVLPCSGLVRFFLASFFFCSI